MQINACVRVDAEGCEIGAGDEHHGDCVHVGPELEASETALGREIGRDGVFIEPRRDDIDRERADTVGQWPAQVPTFGGRSRLPATRLAQLLAGTGAAIKDAGGTFTARYTAPAITADRRTDAAG